MSENVSPQKFITVYDYRDHVSNKHPWMLNEHGVKYVEVNAFCVADFKAFFVIGDYVWEAEGDDGHWWVVGRFQKRWLSDFSRVVEVLVEQI